MASKDVKKACASAWESVGGRSGATVSRAVLLQALCFLGLNPSKASMRDFCGKKDAFAFSDLVAYFSAEHGKDTTSASIEELYRQFTEQCGVLSPAKFATLLQEGGERMTDGEIEQIFRVFDIDPEATESVPLDEMAGVMTDTGALCLNVCSRNISQEDAASRQTWSTKQARGCFLVQEAGPTSTQIQFKLTQPSDVLIELVDIARGSDQRPVDAFAFLCRLSGRNNTRVDLVGISNTSANGQVSMFCEGLAASDYLIVPVTTGAILRARSEQPPLKKMADHAGDDTRLSATVKDSVAEIFKRFDVTNAGGLSRADYDLIVTCTDGEPCDDDTWQYISESVECTNGRMTLQGLNQLYTNVLTMTEGGDEEFYRNFQAIGYNKAMELDEAATYTCKIASPKVGSVGQLLVKPHNGDIVGELWLDHFRSNCTAKPARQSDLLTYIVDSDSLRATYAACNKTSAPLLVTFNTSRSKNHLSSRVDEEVVIEAQPDTFVIGCHLLVDEITRRHTFKVDITAANP
eukprot:m.287190 g.287190  ORF g.287190 m.287190 type:complete len:519 (-) comp55014_c0_seq4:838-2394(-)